jgi:LysR family cys regulon transcriptional activator
MKLQQLRFLLAVVQHDCNVTAAAETLHTSQPGVSKQLRLLEQELGLELFVRAGRRFRALTPAGERIVEHARRAVIETERIRSLAAELRGDSSGTLALATTQTQARYVLPPILRAFRERFDSVDVQLHQGTTEQSAAMMRERQVDFAIVSGTTQPVPEARALPLYRWDRVVVVPRNHPLAAGGGRPSLAALARYPLVTYLFSDRPDSSLMQTFASHGLKPRIAFTARDADVIKTYVRNGLGVGVLASMAIDDQTDGDLTVLEAPGLFPRLTTWIVFPRSPVLRRFHAEFLRLLAPHLPASSVRALMDADAGGDTSLPGAAEVPLLGRGQHRS